MLRSMYSGISGLKNFQTKLDVIGNNISNVNTYGFKKGRVVFKDLISQTTAGSTAPSATRGGVNAKQVGLGSQIAAIDTISTTGALQSTGRVLDLAVSGDGYFRVAPQSGSTDISYTRAGNFYMDAAGDIVTSDGMYLLDTAGNKITVPTTSQSMSIGQDGTVNIVAADGTLTSNQKLSLAKFPNSEGLEKVGSNYFKQSPASGVPDPDVTAQAGGKGAIQSGFLEMSNVDLSEEFTDMIVAQRGFQANSRIITTSDEILQELVNLKR
ncbi:flagellar basal body rod protein FlgG [Ureibacillus aquaedulcis]|uniref:Flagellar basal body rod protein FlgG n=1 Tax=Ureibacillus aquaedulcis TaxID=3058421 RepID=A0ABT8GSP8_9BACL|nr:flagellar basal body rod protein FlgG [Ureibacillus sp. BA0131]MDN4494249.1 flagellar basal body rod protein FlgG [Ureibacillus sp. BA0131]